MNRIHAFANFAATGLLLGTLACGGGSSSGSGPANHAMALTYTNPVSNARSQHFSLVQDAASTPTTLVLDLVGPTDANSQVSGIGVAVSLQVDPTKAGWTSSSFANGTVFTQNGGTPLVWASVKGSVLQGVAANKGRANAVGNLSSGVLAKVTLNLAANATAGTVSLSDGGFSAFLDPNGSEWPMVIQTGTLTVQ